MPRTLVSALLLLSLARCAPSPAVDAATDAMSARDTTTDTVTSDGSVLDAATPEDVTQDVTLDVPMADGATMDAGRDATTDAVSTGDDGGDSGTAVDVSLADGCVRPPVATPPDDGGSCASGQTSCSGRCVDLRNDSRNCGGCGLACAAGLLCAGGICSCACTPPFTCCTDTCLLTRFCANTQSDSRHCGACFRACAAGQTCTLGECR
jgi:hypothetical protein